MRLINNLPYPITIHRSLAGLLFRSFSLNDFPASIGAAGRANVVGQLGVVALRAVDYAGTVNAIVTTPFALACLGTFSLL